MTIDTMIDDLCGEFAQTLRSLVTELRESGLSTSTFGGFIEDLKSALANAGRRAFVSTISEFDEVEKVIQHGGKAHRYKMPSEKTWLTPFGRVVVKRSYYQPDEGGVGVIPLDVRCGMVDRYMTPDIEETCAFASAMLVPREGQVLLNKLLPEAPSVKAIQRTIRDVGGFAERHRVAVEKAIREAAPLSKDGDVLVVSWDGKPVPLREKGVKTGRPPERPGIRSSAESPTAWREAAVGTISIYGPLDQEGRPTRLDAIYQARMPESGMTTFLEGQTMVVRDLLAARTFREVVVICDGKKAIWNAAAGIPEYKGATLILDFYHAVQHLSKAAEAIFGKENRFADKWFKSYRDRLQLEDNAVDAVIRSIRYHRGKLRKNSERFRVLTRVMRHFTQNRERMRYADFIRRGLPIGSGPVEAACKTVVGHRLTRSGMRWTRTGGQHVLNLRAPLLSNRWDHFWKFYLDRRAA